MKQNDTVKKLAMAGVLTAVAVVGSLLSFPIFGSKCAPVQHMVNILAAVVLGPGWGVGIAFCASLIRNLLGSGKPDGISGKYDRCIVLWSGLHGIPKIVADLYRRGIRNWNPWRTCSLSGCKTVYGIEPGRFICIHCAISCFHSCRKYFGIFSGNCAAERRRDQYVQTSG